MATRSPAVSLGKSLTGKMQSAAFSLEGGPGGSAESARGWRASARTRIPGTATSRPQDSVSVRLPPRDSGSTSVNLLAATSGFNTALLGCFHQKKEGRGWRSRNTGPGLQRWKSLLNSPYSCSGHASENCRRRHMLPSAHSVLQAVPLLRVWRLLCSFFGDDLCRRETSTGISGSWGSLGASTLRAQFRIRLMRGMSVPSAEPLNCPASHLLLRFIFKTKATVSHLQFTQTQPSLTAQMG